MYQIPDGVEQIEYKCLGCKAEMRRYYWQANEQFCEKCKDKSDKDWGRFMAKKERGLLR